MLTPHEIRKLYFDFDDDQRPIMYLDVDDTLIRRYGWVDGEYTFIGKGAPDAGEFVKWAVRNFEVRWLTLRCPTGTMEPDALRELARDLPIEREWIWYIRNPLGLWRNGNADTKIDGIDWDETRPWVWVEDRIGEREAQMLRGRHILDRYIPCNVTDEPNRLAEVKQLLCDRFKIP
jgi:hypothetical protein